MRRLQHVRQVRGAARPGAPPVRLRGGRDRPLRPPRRRARTGGRGCSGPRDEDKDQTYFLYGLRQDQLEHARFPLGELTKPEVREVARGLGLATADKPESQEICFVPGGDYRDALRERGRLGAGARPGARRRRRRGSGSTAARPGYTVGQRKGLGVALGEPRYVSRIDPATNTIVLGRREDLETRHIPLDAVTFVADAPPAGRAAEGGAGTPFRAQVRIRHRAPLVDATVRPATDREPARGGSWIVETETPVWAIAPGQACRPVRRRRLPRRRPDRSPDVTGRGGVPPDPERAALPAGARP